MEKNDLKSSVTEKGKIVTQIIIFSQGNKKTFKGIISESISQSEFTRFDLIDGRRIYVNQKNVDCFEIIPENNTQQMLGGKK
ncbi:MAG: hypothetical protein OQK82_02250 [Candidatus Pacearchaeota archaeon]|nr:hypothetical protein [Candidatus Pacearchaeota archaeon]